MARFRRCLRGQELPDRAVRADAGGRGTRREADGAPVQPSGLRFRAQADAISPLIFSPLAGTNMAGTNKVKSGGNAMIETDVLIVGSGPAGSAAALALSTYGIRNMLVT